MPEGGFVWIDDNQEMQRVLKDVGRVKLIAIDTEYDSFHYFREKLCLVQVRTPTGTYLLDPMNIDLAPLAKIFESRSVLKIMHAGDNDLRILSRDYGFDFRNLFDTQRAAGLLGSHHLSLASIISEYLGVDLNKSKKLQRSQWDCRPLSDEQIRYAVEDIQYLIPLYYKLRELLNEHGLWQQAEKTFRDELASAKWTEKTLDPRGHTRINGFQEMKLNQRKRLAALFKWRFEKARETNRAVFMVLSDQAIAELAMGRIYSAESLSRSGILSERKLHQYGAEILAAMKSR